MKGCENGSGKAFIIPKKPRPDVFSHRSTSSEDKSNFNAGAGDHMQHAITNKKDAKLNVWTGSFRFGDQTVESIDLYSPFREGVKPSGFSASLEVQRLVCWRDCLKWAPIMELVKSSTNGTPLLQKQFLPLSGCSNMPSFPSSSTTKVPPQQTTMRASYLYLINTFSPLFHRICNELKGKKQAALGVLANGSTLLLIPEGTLSAQLGCPFQEETSILHCLFISSTTKDSSIHFFDAIPRNPSVAEKFDGADPRFVAKLEQYRRDSGLPLVRKAAPKPIESLLSPNEVPPSGKPPTPYIPTPGYPAHRYSGNATPVGGSKHQQQHQQKYHQQFNSQTSKYGNDLTSADVECNSIYSLAFAPPPPPPPPVETTPISTPINAESTVERRQKNKDMFANAFAQIRNIGKEPSMATTTAMNTPTTTMMSTNSAAFPSSNSDHSKSSQQQLTETGVSSQKTVPPPLTLFAPRDISVRMDPRIKDPRLARHILSNNINATGNTSENTEGGNHLRIEGMDKTTAGQSDTKANSGELTPRIFMDERPQTEVLHETAPMDIDEDDDDDDDEKNSQSSGQQPYSPSHPITSSPSPSPEPMDGVGEQIVENSEKNLNNTETDITKKKKADNDSDDGMLQKIEQTNYVTAALEKSHGRTTILHEIAQIIGTERVKIEPNADDKQQHDSFAADTSSSDMDLTIATTTTSDPSSFVGKTNGASGNTSGTNANTTSMNSFGFGFNYLDWNVIPGGTVDRPIESSSESVECVKPVSLEFLKKIDMMVKGLVENAPADGAKQKAEEEEEEDNDKDFRQLWMPTNNGDERAATNGDNFICSTSTTEKHVTGDDPNEIQQQIHQKPLKQPHDPRLQQPKTKKMLPSLLELNVTPPSSAQSSPPPTAFFANNDGTGQSTSSFATTGSPPLPFISISSSSSSIASSSINATKVPPLAKFRAVPLEISPAAARYQRHKPQSHLLLNDPRLQGQQPNVQKND